MSLKSTIHNPNKGGRRPKFRDPTSKMIWMIQNWELYTTRDLAKIMGTSAEQIRNMATRARGEGFNLLRKNATEWARSSSPRAYNWDAIREKMEGNDDEGGEE